MSKSFIAAIAGGLLVVAAGVAYSVAYYSSGEIQTCLIESKDRVVKVVDGTSRTEHRVYTSCGIFNVEDNLFLGKFNSADTFSSLKEGSTYNLNTYGWRNGFLSLFPNIVEAEEVKR